MSPLDFDRYAGRSRLRARGRAAARAVLVDNRTQQAVALEYGVSKQAVSAWCHAVLRQRRPEMNPPASWRTITLTVPIWLAQEMRRLQRKALDDLNRPPGRPPKNPKQKAPEPPDVDQAAEAARRLLRLVSGGQGQP